MPPILLTTSLASGTAGPPVKVNGMVIVAPYAGEALLRAPSNGLYMISLNWRKLPWRRLTISPFLYFFRDKMSS